MEPLTRGPRKRFLPNFHRDQAICVPHRDTKALFPFTLEKRSRVAAAAFGA
jgi:hypothetical protein